MVVDEYALLLAIQSLRQPWLDLAVRALTALGGTEFTLLLLLGLYWLWPPGLGLRLILLTLISAYLNATVKWWLAWPRPAGPDLWVAEPLTSPGFPSGHAQNATVLYGYLAWVLRRRWATVLALGLILTVGLSRLYLGVHYPHDVLGGIALGALVLLVGIPLLHGSWGERLVRGHPLLLTVGLAGVLLGLLGGDGERSRYAGALAGLALGHLWRARRDLPWLLALRPWRPVGLLLSLLVGLGLALALHLVGLAIGSGPVVVFVRYALLGLVATGLVPWLFSRWAGSTSAVRPPAGRSTTPGPSGPRGP